MSKIAKNRVKSAWTPMTDEYINNKLFEERNSLINKWFEKWSDKQRNIVLTSLMKECSPKQLRFVKQCVDTQLPTSQEDFTRVLPRVISLFIFSFLDPRSLCRCSQVCWFWNHLCELDQLWLPKCIRFGWYLPNLPNPYERSSWKRLYIDKIQTLRLFRTKSLTNLDQQLEELNIEKKQKVFLKTKKSKRGSKPWKRADPHPKDLVRYNYLENNEFDTKRCTEEFYKKVPQPNKSASGKQLINSIYTIRYNHLNKRPASKLNFSDKIILGINSDNDNNNNSIDCRLQETTAAKHSVQNESPQHKSHDTVSNSLFPSQPWTLATDQTDSDS
ncbi:F-box only protein 16-like isoform X1 [Argonauta hians]